MKRSLSTTTHKKRRYAVLWVDDYGSLAMRKRDIRWYHEHAGPISLPVECDDRFPWGFDQAFSSALHEEHSSDYFSHHLHPQRYTGAALLKRVYDVLRVHCYVWFFLRHFRAQSSRGLFRYGMLVTLPVVAIALVALFSVNTIAFGFVLALCTCSAPLAGVWYYVRLPRNWEYLYGDRASIETLISNAEAEFWKRGLTTRQ
jgi:hypothetical protein